MLRRWAPTAYEVQNMLTAGCYGVQKSQFPRLCPFWRLCRMPHVSLLACYGFSRCFIIWMGYSNLYFYLYVVIFSVFVLYLYISTLPLHFLTRLLVSGPWPTLRPGWTYLMFIYNYICMGTVSKLLFLIWGLQFWLSGL